MPMSGLCGSALLAILRSLVRVHAGSGCEFDPNFISRFPCNVELSGPTIDRSALNFLIPPVTNICHRPRPVSSRRRTCADRKHRPRWDQADRRQLCALVGEPDGWTVACAADSPRPPPAIYAPSTHQHCRTCHNHCGSSRNRAAVFRPALSCRPAERGPSDGCRLWRYRACQRHG
jgi:hypothetical protein